MTTHGQSIFESDADLDRLFENTGEMQTEAQTMERYAKWWLSEGKEWTETFSPPSRV